LGSSAEQKTFEETRPQRPSRRNRIAMDSKKFDEVIKQIGTARMTRLSALRSLVGGAALAITGAAIGPELVDARRAKKAGGRSRKKGRKAGRRKSYIPTVPTDNGPKPGPKPDPKPECYADNYEYGDGEDYKRCCNGHCDYLGICGDCPVECDPYTNECPDEPCSEWECVDHSYVDEYGQKVKKGFCEYTALICEEKECKAGSCNESTGYCEYVDYCDSDTCCTPRNKCEYAICDTATGECGYEPVTCDDYYTCDPYADNYTDENPCGYPQDYYDQYGKYGKKGRPA
jgi:hypothetical protein